MIDYSSPAGKVCARSSVVRNLVDVRNNTWVGDSRSMDSGDDTTRSEDMVHEDERRHAEGVVAGERLKREWVTYETL